MKKKKGLFMIAVMALVVIFTACQSTDIVAKTAVSSFEDLLKTVPQDVSYSADELSWVLASEKGDQFKWSKDFSSTTRDLSMEFDGLPFINAGLDVSKLPADYAYDQSTNRLSIQIEAGQEQFQYSGEATALDSFKKIVEAKRELIGYHVEMDHYGITLGDGNMFEWAKDMSKNDKDIVFVLNPQPFIDAGVDPNAVEGWVFGKVEMMDKSGKKMTVDKLLKPFDIK